MRYIQIFAAVVAAVVGMLAFTPTVQAVDGVIEINQTRALAGNVTPGDSAGFPVTISKPGSYRLTSNLDVRLQPTPQDVTAIEITSSNVTIDLNGYAIIGPNSCTFTATPSPAVTCTTSGGGNGISVNDGTTTGTAIANGTVRGMGAHGISMSGNNMQIERIRIEQNAFEGISMANGLVSHVTSALNGGTGIDVTNGAVSHSFAAQNGRGGIGIGGGLVTRSVLVDNISFGMSLGPQVGYVENTSSGTTPIAGGVSLGQNLCNGVVC